MMKLGENHTDIKDCIRLYNEHIASLPIFAKLGILDEGIIWFAIFVFKQSQLNQRMKKILPITLSANIYTQMVEKVMEFSEGMRSEIENALFQKNLTLKGSSAKDG